MRHLIFLLALMSLTLTACLNDDDTIIFDPQAQYEIDIAKIENYLSENNLTAEIDSSSGVYLYHIIEEEGEGGHPPVTSMIEVKYQGYLLDGIVFDETAPGQTATFVLQNLVPGWQIGIPLLQKGGKGTFILPSALGFGNIQQGDIPPNSVLIFEVELVDFF